MMATEGSCVLSIENMEEGRDYWIYFSNPQRPDESQFRGAFFDTFLGVENIAKDLYLRFERQGLVSLHSITRIQEAGK